MKNLFEQVKFIAFGMAMVAAAVWIGYIAGYIIFVKILPAIFNI